MSWCGTKKANKLLKNPSDIAVFDLETTGLSRQTAEILQICICDGNGTTLFSSYVKPKARSWKSAERVNHISPETVADAPTFAEIRPEIQKIFNRAKVVAGYNCKGYDIPILERYGITVPTQCFDVMSEFRVYHPVGSHRLKDCAEFCGVFFTPHDAESDASTTAECMQHLLRSPGFVKAETEPARHEEEAVVSEKEKRPLASRLLGPFAAKHKRHPIIFGVLLAAVGLGLLDYQAGGSLLRIGTGLPALEALLSAARESGRSMIYGALIPVGIIISAIGIFRSIKRFILRIINAFRKLLAKL